MEKGAKGRRDEINFLLDGGQKKEGNLTEERGFPKF